MIQTGHTALVLKLGGACNLQCAFCHALKEDYPFNEDIMEFMKQGAFTRITFSGGEPFLYFDRMRAVMEYLGPGIAYRSPTNGTVITEEMVDFINGYDFNLFLSYDGRETGRDLRVPVKYHVLNRFRGLVGISTVAGPGCDYRRLTVDVGVVIRKRLDRLDAVQPNILHFNFPHQTENARVAVSEADVDAYITYLCRRLDSDLFELTRGNLPLRQLNELNKYVQRYASAAPHTEGVACCNTTLLNMNLAGEFTLCPYSHKVVGDIYRGLDMEKVTGFIPERCRKCSLFPYCRNTCIENTTDNECRIFMATFTRFLALCEEYGVDPAQLAAERAGGAR